MLNKEQEVTIKYLFYKDWKYTWEFTRNSETAKSYAKIGKFYIMYEINWVVIDPLKM